MGIKGFYVVTTALSFIIAITLTVKLILEIVGEYDLNEDVEDEKSTNYSRIILPILYLLIPVANMFIVMYYTRDYEDIKYSVILKLREAGYINED